MAELNNDAAKGKESRKIRSKKLSSKVDLTAMVDLAFLLITFFMLTTSLSKPQSMDLVMPDNTPIDRPMPVDENRTMTILIGKDDQLQCYMGMLNGKKPTQFAFDDSKMLRTEIAANKRKAFAYGEANDKPKDLIVLIKPSKKSNYKNLVDVLDEMAISDVKTFAITDLAKEEKELVAMR